MGESAIADSKKKPSKQYRFEGFRFNYDSKGYLAQRLITIFLEEEPPSFSILRK